MPTGSGEIDPLSIHEYFPENGGIQLEPREQVVFHSMTVRPLEWIALRYEELGDEIRPEAPQTLIRMNPLHAEPILSGLLGLPKETAAAFIIGFLRRDFGAAGLYHMADAGALDAVQIVVAAVTMKSGAALKRMCLSAMPPPWL